MLSKRFLFSAIATLPPVLFLSTCAVCHQIKDKEGSWCPPEDFAREIEAGAVRTHTICRSCLKKSYPEFWRTYSGMFKGEKAKK